VSLISLSLSLSRTRVHAHTLTHTHTHSRLNVGFGLIACLKILILSILRKHSCAVVQSRHWAEGRQHTMLTSPTLEHKHCYFPNLPVGNRAMRGWMTCLRSVTGRCSAGIWMEVCLMPEHVYTASTYTSAPGPSAFTPRALRSQHSSTTYSHSWRCLSCKCSSRGFAESLHWSDPFGSFRSKRKILIWWRTLSNYY
jgi:hypothetical protein